MMSTLIYYMEGSNVWYRRCLIRRLMIHRSVYPSTCRMYVYIYLSPRMVVLYNVNANDYDNPEKYIP